MKKKKHFNVRLLKLIIIIDKIEKNYRDKNENYK
jgi:hypothetical protein